MNKMSSSGASTTSVVPLSTEEDLACGFGRKYLFESRKRRKDVYIYVRGDMHPALWGNKVGNSWRTTDDIASNWDRMKFMQILQGLRVGMAPLLIDCDVRNVTKETMKIIGNKEVIAVNQDSLGVQAKKVILEGNSEIWAAPLSGYKVVVILLNRSSNMHMTMTAQWDDIGIPPESVVRTRHLWEGAGEKVVLEEDCFYDLSYNTWYQIFVLRLWKTRDEIMKCTLYSVDIYFD